MYSYTRDASRCLAILSINTSRLFTEGSVIPPEHRLMLVNFHRECIGDAKKSPVGPRHYLIDSIMVNSQTKVFDLVMIEYLQGVILVFTNCSWQWLLLHVSFYLVVFRLILDEIYRAIGL